jgi:hypothetical protein
MKLLSNDEMRKILKEADLIVLLDKYRYDPELLTETDKQLVYFGVNDWVTKLARKHYGQRQRTGHYVNGSVRQWYEPIKGNFDGYTKQCFRVDIALRFLREGKGSTKALVYAFNRRYPWVEMLIELKYYGVALLDETLPIDKQINSVLLRLFILGNSLSRKYKEEHEGKNASLRDVLKELCKHLIKQGKTVRYSVLDRFIRGYSQYLNAKQYANPILGYNESIGSEENEVQGDNPF